MRTDKSISPCDQYQVAAAYRMNLSAGAVRFVSYRFRGLHLCFTRGFAVTGDVNAVNLAYRFLLPVCTAPFGAENDHRRSRFWIDGLLYDIELFIHDFAIIAEGLCFGLPFFIT